MPLVIGCRARLYAVVYGNRRELHRQNRLTVYLNDDVAPSLIVRDQLNVNVRQIFLESEVDRSDRYVFRSRHLHEIFLCEGHTLLLRLDRCHANASVFSSAMEEITRNMDIFSSGGTQVRDSDGSSSGSDDDDDLGPTGAGAGAAPRESRASGATAAAALQTTRSRIQTMWDCSACHLANHRNQMQCGECGRNRPDVWQCHHCTRVYRLAKSRCSWCDIWRCRQCTFLNEATSPAHCYGCGSDRRS